LEVMDYAKKLLVMELRLSSMELALPPVQMELLEILLPMPAENAKSSVKLVKINTTVLLV